MDIRKLQRAIVDGLEDVKAQNISVFNTEHLSPLFERVIIASGTSNRQTKALAASVRDCVRARGMQVLRTEGEGTGEWIIVDCGAAVVHVMQPGIREYYHLEELWGDKPVRMKSEGPATKGLPKAASAAPTAEPAAKSRAGEHKKSPARAPARPTRTAVSAKRAAAPRVSAAPSPAAAPTATRKAPARVARGTVTRGAAAKTAARKAPVRAPAKTIVRSAGAKAPAAKRAGGGAAPARKVPAAKKR